MKTRSTLFAIILVCIFFVSNAQETNFEKIIETFYSISNEELLDFAEELSFDKYIRRLSSSPEYLEVANWCASKFEEWGVKPANTGSYCQYLKKGIFRDKIAWGILGVANDTDL